MLERFIQMQRLLRSRLRARQWALRGSAIGPKVGVGDRSRVDYPAGVSIGTRVTLEADVWLKLVNPSARVQIGEFSFVGRGSELDVADSIVVGANSLIAPRVFITDHSHNTGPDQPIAIQGCSSGRVKIGDDVWLGTGVVVLPGVEIGDGAVVGAGAVVRQSIPAGEIWAGVPARKIRERN